MSTNPFSFNPPDGWQNVTEFPEKSTSATQVRGMLQRLHSQTRDFINSVILPAIDAPIGTVKLASKAVTTDKLDDLAVTSAKIASGAVTEEKIGTSSVNTSSIKDSAVTAAKLASNAVEAAKIQDGAVTTAKINGGAVTTPKIANANVTLDKVDFVSQTLNDNNSSVPTGAAVKAALRDPALVSELREVIPLDTNIHTYTETSKNWDVTLDRPIRSENYSAIQLDLNIFGAQLPSSDLDSLALDIYLLGKTSGGASTNAKIGSVYNTDQSAYLPCGVQLSYTLSPAGPGYCFRNGYAKGQNQFAPSITNGAALPYLITGIRLSKANTGTLKTCGATATIRGVK